MACFCFILTHPRVPEKFALNTAEEGNRRPVAIIKNPFFDPFFFLPHAHRVGTDNFNYYSIV